MTLNDVLNGSYQRYSASDFLKTLSINKRISLIVTGVDDGNVEEVKTKLLNVFGDVNVTLVSDGEKTLPVSSLIGGNVAPTLYIEGREFLDCKRFDFYDFVEILKRLRRDDGCEWDKAQTHESIRINLIEEAYELLEGIDMKNADMMKEECGDVLLQAIFHTEIAEKDGEFDYNDMFTNLCRKLIDRHTHIFGINHADNPEQALVFWTEAKKKEKKYSSNADAMDRVPKNMPSLLYAEKVQKIARKSGFDWDSPSDAIVKLQEEIKELQEASDGERAEEAGDLLFAAVNVVRLYKIECEIALREASKKFLRRFEGVEKLTVNDGKDMRDYTLEELDKFWEIVKQQEKATKKS